MRVFSVVLNNYFILRVVIDLNIAALSFEFSVEATELVGCTPALASENYKHTLFAPLDLQSPVLFWFS